MMSFGGGWFFLAASEAINVLGNDIRLPGIGSFMSVAVENGDMRAMCYAIITMIVMILLVDQLFWKPLVVWAQKFKMELTAASEVPSSWAYDLLSRSTVIQMVAEEILHPLFHIVHVMLNGFANWTEQIIEELRYQEQYILLGKLGKGGLWILVALWLGNQLYNGYRQGLIINGPIIVECLELGSYTLGRVIVAVFLGVLWSIPIGVWIGMNHKIANRLQAVVQIAASFPANMIFPFVAIIYLSYGVNFEYGAIPLMMLGTQWYILFNVIAGAMAIPTDLREACIVFKLTGWKKWRSVILPGIFPYLVTGMVTASGGAWNASIVSELVRWKGQELIATGLGAYISQVTREGEWVGILCGIGVMCIFVVGLNRFLWHRLYKLAESKYRMD